MKYCAGILFAITFIIFLDPLQATAIIHSNHLKSKIDRRLNSCLKNVTYPPAQTNNDHSSANNAKCVELIHQYCLDILLPYTSTTLPDYLPDLQITTIRERESYLQSVRKFRILGPECWDALNVGYCSILMPQCYEDRLTGKVTRVSRPNVDICNNVRARCPFIERHFGFPSIFNCSDSNLYARNCSNELRDLSRSSKTGECQYPLVPSNDSKIWFKDIQGCAIHCKFPILDPGDQININVFVRILCTIGLICTCLAIILFSTNGTSSKSSRMAKVIRQCNILQFIRYLGWSLQMVFNSDMTCSSSGSTLYGLPFRANTCILSFVLTYLPSLSSLFWCAYLGKLCHEKLIGKDKKSLDHVRLDRTLSMLSYIVPLTLLVTVAMLGQIDGHGLYGICTIGQQSMVMKALFIFAPRIIGTTYGNAYFLVTIFKLKQVETMKPSLKRNFMRMIALATLSTLHVIFSLWVSIYEFRNRSKWIESVDSDIAQSLNFTSFMNDDFEPEVLMPRERTIDSVPLIMLYYIELFCSLAIGFVIASWAFCESNLRGLRRKIIDILEDDKDKQRRADAYFSLAVGGAETNGKVINNHQNGFEVTPHHLIDMSSPTGTNHELELVNNLNRPKTPTSLASAELPPIQHNRRTSRNRNNEMSAREVINDQRCINERQLELTNLPAAQNPSTLPNLTIEQIMVQVIMMRSRSLEASLVRLQQNIDNEPQSMHGIGGDIKPVPDNGS